MRDVAIVTDSTCDLPKEWLERYGMSVVPLSVVIDGVTYEDGSFTQEEYFAKMDSLPNLPTTALPPIGLVQDVYRQVLESANSIVSVHISSKLSGTFQAAADAAHDFGDRVTVFDSLNLSGGLGLVAAATAKAAQAGRSVKEVISVAEAMREKVVLYVGFDGLENLAKGGRIGKVAKFAGGMLNVKPTIEVIDGIFEPLSRVRGSQAQLRQIMDRLTADVADRAGGTFIVLHAMALDRAQSLREEIVDRFKPAEIIIQEAGTVISTHTGTGIGVAFLPAD